MCYNQCLVNESVQSPCIVEINEILMISNKLLHFPNGHSIRIPQNFQYTISLSWSILQHRLHSLPTQQHPLSINNLCPCISGYTTSTLVLENCDVPYKVEPFQDRFDLDPLQTSFVTEPSQPRQAAWTIGRAGPHVCGDCGKSYKQWGNLTRHQKFECGVLPKFRCHYCPHRSSRKCNMETHVISVHRGMAVLFHVDSE